MFLNSTWPPEGQSSGGSKFPISLPSDGVILSSIFKRAIAPREISSVVQFSTSFSNVEFATSIILRAIPTCPPLIRPRNTTAIATTLIAINAVKRSRTRLSHLWREKRRNSGRWDFSTQRMLFWITSSDQSNARIVSRPST